MCRPGHRAGIPCRRALPGLMCERQGLAGAAALGWWLAGSWPPWSLEDREALWGTRARARPRRPRDWPWVGVDLDGVFPGERRWTRAKGSGTV